MARLLRSIIIVAVILSFFPAPSQAATPKPASITIYQSADVSTPITTLSLEPSSSKTLVAVIKDTKGNAINKQASWAIKNKKIATVKKGVVAAVAEGSTIITVKYKTVKTTITVTVAKVVDPPVDPLEEYYGEYDMKMIGMMQSAEGTLTLGKEAGIGNDVGWCFDSTDLVHITLLFDYDNQFAVNNNLITFSGTKSMMFGAAVTSISFTGTVNSNKDITGTFTAMRKGFEDPYTGTWTASKKN